MAIKPKSKKNLPQDGANSHAVEKSPGSRKMLLAAAVMCFISLGGGFFLARTAYLQDAEVYEPEYKDKESNAADAHGEEADGHSDKKGGPELRTDIADPLAKDGHDAEHAFALQAKKEGGHENGGGEEINTGLLSFGDFLTNIEGTTSQGVSTKAFLKINLVVAYRTDEGAGKLMQERQPFMRDLFNGYLRGLSQADIRGMAGIMYIKAELLKRARAAAGNDLPQEILINDLIVQ
jgi:flagellar FliL protein